MVVLYNSSNYCFVYKKHIFIRLITTIICEFDAFSCSFFLIDDTNGKIFICNINFLFAMRYIKVSHILNTRLLNRWRYTQSFLPNMSFIQFELEIRGSIYIVGNIKLFVYQWPLKIIFIISFRLDPALFRHISYSLVLFLSFEVFIALIYTKYLLFLVYRYIFRSFGIYLYELETINFEIIWYFSIPFGNPKFLFSVITNNWMNGNYV